MNIKRSVLHDALADDEVFQLALAAAVKRSYEVFADDLPEQFELTNDDYTVLIDVVAEQLRGLYRGDVTIIRIEHDRRDSIRVRAVAE